MVIADRFRWVMLFLAATLVTAVVTELVLFTSEELVEQTALGACLSQPCVHGLCEPLSSGQYHCYCRNGYTGFNCGTNYDDCQSNPCRNNGSCIDGEDNFLCICAEGYTGEFCENELNECLSNPCMNNGVCEDLLNSYVCHCPLAYEGVNCERYFNICEPQNGEVCQNGGTCFLLPGNIYSCSCPESYFGENCQLSDCPCLRGGVCLNKPVRSCLCPLGWTGENCETEVEFCEESVCSHRGICILNTASSETSTNGSLANSACFCVPDYHGQFCESQYNECIAHSLCGNNATCIDGVDSYTCQCSDGSTGLYCNESELCGNDDCLPDTSTISLSFTASQECMPDCDSTTGFYDTEYISISSTPMHIHTLSSSFQSSLFSASSGEEVLFESGETSTAVSSSFLIAYPFMTIAEEYSVGENVFQLSSSALKSYFQTNSFFEMSFSPSVIFSSVVESTTHSSLTTAGGNDMNEMPKTVIPMNSDGQLFFEANSSLKPADAMDAISSDQMPMDEANFFDICYNAKCQNGGSAVPKLMKNRNGHQYKCECLCKLHFTGQYCEDVAVILVPQFHGQSYIVHALPAVRPLEKMEIHIVFKTLADRGLVFYASAANTNAFLLLFVEDGLLKLQFSCGHEMSIVMENHTPVLNQYTSVTLMFTWNKLTKPIEHSMCTTGLLVNDSAPVKAEHFASSPVIPEFSHLYIGGLPSEHAFSDLWLKKMAFFKGCLIKLKVNGKEKDLISSAKDGAYITECFSSVCYQNPCFNGGTCKNYGDHWNCECPHEFSGPLCEYKTCSADPCSHGATCVPDLQLGYLCLCPYGKQGQSCENDTQISYPSFFGNIGEYTSFIQYEQQLYHYHMELRIAFATNDLMQNSLLLFHGSASESLQPHFLAVTIKHGFVLYFFNFGSGTRILKSPNSLDSRNAVHRIQIGKHQRYGWLEVDSQTKVMGVAPGPLYKLSVPVLFVGGHNSTNFSALASELKGYSGFQGCVLDIQVRNSPDSKFVAVQKVVGGRSVGQCNMSECSFIRCNNGGICVANGTSFRCICPEEYTGPLCTERETACSEQNNRCASYSRCVPLKDGYRCDCPFGFIGSLCREAVTISVPSFNGINSYLSLPNKNIRHEMEVMLEVKPLSASGLLFYSAQYWRPLSHDFFAVFLSSGFVKYVYNLGTASSLNTKLSSSSKVEMGKWHIIRFGRYKRAAYLKVNNDPEVTAVSPAGRETLDISTRFFIGGLPNFLLTAEESLDNETAYFNGCISVLQINGDHVDLNMHESEIIGWNVRPCNKNVCENGLCWNNSSCEIESNGNCICKSGTSWKKCEVAQHNFQCMNGATVVSDNGIASCYCPVGWTGSLCEKRSGVSFTAFFKGKSYFQYKDSIYDVARTNISFLFSTALSSALLFCTSEGYSEDGDYLIVGLQNYHLYVVWNLGQKAEISTSKLSDEKDFFHFVHIYRYKKSISLTVDNSTYRSEIPGNFIELNSQGSYNFGGFVDAGIIEEKTGGIFSSPFAGCMKDIFISGHKINIGDEVYGQNVDTCF